MNSDITLGIHVITTQHKFKQDILIYDEEDVIIECEYSAKPYLESFRSDQIIHNKYIVVGN